VSLLTLAREFAKRLSDTDPNAAVQHAALTWDCRLADARTREEVADVFVEVKRAYFLLASLVECAREKRDSL
jgi:hypothetical protein